SDANKVLTLNQTITIQVENLSNKLNAYRKEQIQFADLRTSFAKQSNQLLSTLRERGKASTADTIYVVGNKIDSLLVSSVDTDLDQVFELNGQLESLESSLPTNLQAPLRNLVNNTYALNALKRSMNEAVIQMNTSGITSDLNQLTKVLNQDQTYVSGAVSDARILLNISTILLLSLLAFLGLRLQRSYRALNSSHDDLELRVQDRTVDLEKANDDLKESQVQLVQAEKMSSLGQLVAGVMHEINTPLLYVQNNTAMTAEAIEELDHFVELTLPLLTASSNEDVKSVLNNLSAERGNFNAKEIAENLAEAASLAQDSREGLEQIGELVQSLKDFSRLDRIADDKFDVREGIEKTLVITRNLLKQGVEVVKDLQEVPEIFCSPSRLNQVFINLVTNAIQAMDGIGTLSIKTRWLQKGKDGESVEVEFQDTGCGIAEEHLNKIMDPFFTTKPVGQGTGLGLSIVRQIVDQHQGQILIDSKVGVGSRITLNFPITANSALANETQANNEEAA
ncbi:MAG: signal transduction histidine kinase, partial [Limisphaerales bacterium]